MEWAKVVGNNLIISDKYICLYISHAMHPHDIHQSFLSEINPSLVDQMFTVKECLDTTDRFLWHGGIQKCDIVAKVTKNYVLS